MPRICTAAIGLNYVLQRSLGAKFWSAVKDAAEGLLALVACCLRRTESLHTQYRGWNCLPRCVALGASCIDFVAWMQTSHPCLRLHATSSKAGAVYAGSTYYIQSARSALQEPVYQQLRMLSPTAQCILQPAAVQRMQHV